MSVANSINPIRIYSDPQVEVQAIPVSTTQGIRLLPGQRSIAEVYIGNVQLFQAQATILTSGDTDLRISVVKSQMDCNHITLSLWNTTSATMLVHPGTNLLYIVSSIANISQTDHDLPRVERMSATDHPVRRATAA